jgi:hypothetical protein
MARGDEFLPHSAQGAFLFSLTNLDQVRSPLPAQRYRVGSNECGA